jgi:hypothetical protein
VDSAIQVEIELSAELSISVPKLTHSALPVVLHAIETSAARVEDLGVSFRAIHAIPICAIIAISRCCIGRFWTSYEIALRVSWGPQQSPRFVTHSPHCS